MMYTRFIEELSRNDGTCWLVSRDGYEDPSCEPILITFPYISDHDDGEIVKVIRDDQEYSAILWDDIHTSNIYLHGVQKIL